jgi:hypothetical protein
MSSLPADNSGSGTSLLETLQQMGGVLGVAALGSLLATGYTNRLDVSKLPADAAQAAKSSVTGGDAVAARTHDDALLLSTHQAFTRGMDLVLVVCAAAALVAAVFAALCLPGRSAAGEPVADAVAGRARSGLPESATAGP